jgi:spermidine/putrescine transport system substrate-binding protein
VYDPKVAAVIEAYIYYVSPVKGADAEIKKLDDSAATNPLLFPTPEVVAKQHNFQALSDDNEKILNDLYSKLSGT